MRAHVYSTQAKSELEIAAAVASFFTAMKQLLETCMAWEWDWKRPAGGQDQAKAPRPRHADAVGSH